MQYFFQEHFKKIYWPLKFGFLGIYIFKPVSSHFCKFLRVMIILLE